MLAGFDPRGYNAMSARGLRVEKAGIASHICNDNYGSNRNGIKLSSNTPLINKLRASHGD